MTLLLTFLTSLASGAGHQASSAIASKLGIEPTSSLSEPEPTLPFGLSLSEPTYQHLPTFLGLLNINFTEKLPKIIFFNIYYYPYHACWN